MSMYRCEKHGGHGFISDCEICGAEKMLTERDKHIAILQARWDYIKADPDGARSLLILLREGKGTPDDFDTMIDRIIESRKGAGIDDTKNPAQGGLKDRTGGNK